MPSTGAWSLVTAMALALLLSPGGAVAASGGGLLRCPQCHVVAQEISSFLLSKSNSTETVLIEKRKKKVHPHAGIHFFLLLTYTRLFGVTPTVQCTRGGHVLASAC